MIPTELRSLMGRCGWSATRLASILGVSRRQVDRWIHGHSQMKRLHQLAIERAEQMSRFDYSNSHMADVDSMSLAEIDNIVRGAKKIATDDPRGGPVRILAEYEAVAVHKNDQRTAEYFHGLGYVDPSLVLARGPWALYFLSDDRDCHVADFLGVSKEDD